MSTHRHIDRVCIAVLILTLLITVLFMNGEALGIEPVTAADTVSMTNAAEITLRGADAVIGSVVIGLILLVFVNRKSSANPYILVLQCDGHESEAAAKEYLDGVTQRCTVKSKTARAGAVELNYELRLKDDNTDFINVLSGMQGVRSAALVSYNGDYMG